MRLLNGQKMAHLCTMFHTNAFPTALRLRLDEEKPAPQDSDVGHCEVRSSPPPQAEGHLLGWEYRIDPS